MVLRLRSRVILRAKQGSRDRNDITGINLRLLTLLDSIPCSYCCKCVLFESASISYSYSCSSLREVLHLTILRTPLLLLLLSAVNVFVLLLLRHYVLAQIAQTVLSVHIVVIFFWNGIESASSFFERRHSIEIVIVVVDARRCRRSL